MQIEITLQRSCLRVAYYAYPKNDDEPDSQQYAIVVPHFNMEMPKTISVEVSETNIPIHHKGEVIDNVTSVGWDCPVGLSSEVPQILGQFGLKTDEGEPSKQQFRTIEISSIEHLLSYSFNSKSRVFKTIPIMARSYPSSIPTIQSGRFFIQNVCEKGVVLAIVMRDNHNKYSGWRISNEAIEFFNGSEDQKATLFLAGGHIIASVDSQGRTEYHLNWLQNIIWEKLDDDSKSLVNSWLESEINENVVAQDTSDTCKRDVLIRNKELGLVPVGEWAKGLFETTFDSNPNLMTDDEYHMIFGEER